jgi:hypothetical protein
VPEVTTCGAYPVTHVHTENLGLASSKSTWSCCSSQLESSRLGGCQRAVGMCRSLQSSGRSSFLSRSRANADVGPMWLYPQATVYLSRAMLQSRGVFELPLLIGYRDPGTRSRNPIFLPALPGPGILESEMAMRVRFPIISESRFWRCAGAIKS